MPDFFKQDVETRKLAFETVASEMGVDPIVVEKDLWVVVTLKALFSNSLPDIFLFKGGTSLSKAYEIIERFSEDIDITIDRTYFKTDASTEEMSDLSRNKRDKQIALIIEETLEFLDTEVRPTLLNKIRSITGLDVQIKPSETDPQALEIYYPSTLGNTLPYIKPRVLIEFGVRGDQFPAEKKEISSYIHQNLAQLDKITATALVLSPLRTLFEKATHLHAINHRPESKTTPERLSRHYYDLHQLVKKGYSKNLSTQLDILQDVITNKFYLFPAKWAGYDKILQDGINLIPSPALTKQLESDYEQMAPMFFYLETTPSIDDIFKSITTLEAEINSAIDASL